MSAVGLSVFVTEDFARQALTAPEPHLNARLHRMIVEDRSPILDKAAVAKANSGRGLTLMPLHFAMANFDASDPEIRRIVLAAQDTFRLTHAGFRVDLMLKEVIGTDLCRYMVATGLKIHCDFAAEPMWQATGHLPETERPYLLSASPAEMPLGSTLSMMFSPPARRFNFSPAEQKLLRAALLLDTDEELARELCLSPDTLRKQWRSIFERVLMADPLFFADEEEAVANGTSRGRGKRRQLLQYLHNYLEELRPYRKAGNCGARRSRSSPSGTREHRHRPTRCGQVGDLFRRGTAQALCMKRSSRA